MLNETKRLDTTAKITISPEARFYCLIGKKEGVMEPHTFFHMGAIDEKDVAIPLLEIGKVGDLGTHKQEGTCDILCNALFNETGAIIRNEHHLLRKDCQTDLSFNVNYVAFETTRAQYLYFLGVLKHINQQQLELFDYVVDSAIVAHSLNTQEQVSAYETKIAHAIFPAGELKAYQPTVNTNIFEYLPVSKCSDSNTSLNQATQSIEQALALSYANTCRHTGIDFLKQVLIDKQQAVSKLVPSQYFMPFACHNTMKAGRYGSPLYLLPLPPNGLELAANEQAIMQTLYQRMEGLLQHHFFHPNTHGKFTLLKNIYGQLSDEKSSTINFLEVIVAHANSQTNKATINKHRGWHWPFFHSTRTSDMFERFEHQLHQTHFMASL